MWCVPELNDEYIMRMEKVLNLYEKPINKRKPVLCFDEKPVQLLGEKKPLKRIRKPGDIQKRDYEYIRKGTANIFSCVEPKAGKHLTDVYKKKKGKDFARFCKKIITAYPEADVICLVMDNYSTHTKKALIDYYGEKVGLKMWNRFKIYYTPKHGSWLNQAEIENSICSQQCIGKRRFSKLLYFKKEVRKWTARANKQKLKINWRFTTKKAREKFKY